jgi:hypothetical protein
VVEAAYGAPWRGERLAVVTVGSGLGALDVLPRHVGIAWLDGFTDLDAVTVGALAGIEGEQRFYCYHLR